MKWILPCLGVLLTFASRGEAYYPLAPNQPRVCRAVVNKGMVELRYFRGTAPFVMPFKATATNEKGLPYEFTYNITREHFVEQQLAIDAAHVEAYGTDGKKIAGKDMLPLLEKETAVLACSTMPDLDMLKIMKKGTLLLIVPTSLDGHGGYGGGIVVMPAPVPPGQPRPRPPEEKKIPPKGT